MPKFQLEPAGDYVLAVDAPQEVSIGGIDMPSNVRQQDMYVGTVVAAGPDATRTKIEDRVMYGPYAGKPVAFNGVEFRLLREGQIEAYIRQTN
jgi:co-chaperonin GroES (HSP10)